MGNFIGDFVKGSDFNGYSDVMAMGIKLHREIDQFTDSHPVVLESKLLLREKYRHYAPVIVDIYYDHFLAANWDSKNGQPLLSFTNHFYKMAEKYLDKIPKTAVRVLGYMKADNWLYNYKFTEGIHRALVGMSRRTTFHSKMEESAEDLEQHYSLFQQQFDLFFPELETFCKQFIADNTYDNP